MTDRERLAEVEGRPEADRHRSTPGHVYGVGSACSGAMEPFTPDCSCPCHLADAPCPSSWYCNLCGGIPMWLTTADKPRVPYTHEDAMTDGREHPRQPMRNVVDHYFITKGNTLSDELEEHFPTLEKAEARAKELNEADVIASLNLSPKLERRLRRFKDLVTHHWTWTSEYGWAHKPGRYAIESWWDDGDATWSTESSLGKVEEEIKGGNVERVVDLDTGEDVPFARVVTVKLADSGLSCGEAP